MIRGHNVTKPSNQAKRCKGNLAKLSDILLLFDSHQMGNLMTPADPNPHNIVIDINDLSRRQIFVLKFQVHLGLYFFLNCCGEYYLLNKQKFKMIRVIRKVTG